MNTSIQTDDNEYARYLATFLCQNDYRIIEQVSLETSPYLNYEELVKLITEYENSLL